VKTWIWFALGGAGVVIAGVWIYWRTQQESPVTKTWRDEESYSKRGDIW
jgi:hypothetical protein